MAALHKTRGIVINYLKYGETSIITRIFTETFGIQSYIINGVRSKKPRFSISFFQPLSLLNLVVYKKKNASLNRISEVECTSSASSISIDIYKSGIAIFISEILSKTLKEEMEDQRLFHFLNQSIQILDQLKGGFENFHLLFLIKFSHYLGFSPISGTEILSQIYQHIDHESLEEVKYFDQLIDADFSDHIKMNGDLRRQLLEDLIRYYQIHIENFGVVRSMDVLREVMR